MSTMKPRLRGTARWACDVMTLRQLARLAIALTIYKAKHGHYADQLEDLTPALLNRLPRDPWDGGPLHMMRTNKGVRLYTARNGQDEPILLPDTTAQRRDVVFRLP